MNQPIGAVRLRRSSTVRSFIRLRPLGRRHGTIQKELQNEQHDHHVSRLHKGECPYDVLRYQLVSALS